MALEGTMAGAAFPFFARQRSFAANTAIIVEDANGVLWADGTVGTPVLSAPLPTVMTSGAWVLVTVIAGSSIDVTPVGGATINDAGATIEVETQQGLWLFAETTTNWVAMFAF